MQSPTWVFEANQLHVRARHATHKMLPGTIETKHQQCRFTAVDIPEMGTLSLTGQGKGSERFERKPAKCNCLAVDFYTGRAILCVLDQLGRSAIAQREET